MELKCLHLVWLATSDPVSSDVDTGPSDEESNDEEDVGYGAAQPPATPMDVDPIASEGKASRNEVGEEWQVASEMRADLAAATLAGLVVYGTSSDDVSGDEEEEEEEEKKAEGGDDKTSDADDEREQEQEQEDQLNGGEMSDSALKTKGKVVLFLHVLTTDRVLWVGYTHTRWPVHLNQWLQQGKTQPAMSTHMVEMEEEGLLEVRISFPFRLFMRPNIFCNSHLMRSATAAVVGADVSCPPNLTMATSLAPSTSSAVMGAPTMLLTLLLQGRSWSIRQKAG